jgi:stress response protein YsnF
MSRTVAALYDSRAEAEIARSRLFSGTRAKAPRIIAKDTLGAVDVLRIDQKDKARYRDALQRGAHLLVAQVPAGTSAKRIVELLEEAVTDSAMREHVSEAPPEGRYGFELDRIGGTAREPALETAAAPVPAPQAEPQPVAEMAPPEPVAAAPVVEEERIPVVEEELVVGKREVARGGARVRSFMRDTEAEEQVALNDEIIDVESRPLERRLSDEEVQSGGLFSERVFEVAEMREEPVVTKVAVVREEVIIRKTVKERTETVRDTVRRTEVQVEDLAAPGREPPTSATDKERPTFFTRGPTAPGGR